MEEEQLEEPSAPQWIHLLETSIQFSRWETGWTYVSSHQILEGSEEGWEDEWIEKDSNEQECVKMNP